jgi:N-acylneuraminate cytidylyltransferase/CMP-N,N'-diacetyllegionaminic acid synthase
LNKPLIAHSIQQALDSKLFEIVAVSSDSNEILETAKKWGAQFCLTRPQEMALDTSPKVPAIRHALLETEKYLGQTFDTLVDLDCTSPLRTVSDIEAVVSLLESTQAQNVITGCPARRSPYFNLVEVNDRGVAHLSKSPPGAVVRRQDAPRCFDMNASIYAWTRQALVDNNAVFLPTTALYEMKEEQAYDIDSELDFEWVELIATRHGFL